MVRSRSVWSAPVSARLPWAVAAAAQKVYVAPAHEPTYSLSPRLNWRGAPSFSMRVCGFGLPR